MWTVVDRKSKELIGFEIGTRDTRHFENLYEKTSHINPKKYATDCYASYNLIDPARELIGKAYTSYTVKRMNRLLCHYLVHLHEKLTANQSVSI